MNILKTITTLIRKLVFHPFGYDVVPIKQTANTSTVPKIEQQKANLESAGLADYIRFFGQEAVEKKRFYNVGAGPNFHHPAWTRIDHPSDHYGHESIDIAWDLMSSTPLPINPGTARIVYSRYTLEHVPDEAVRFFLAESYRVLKPGGYLRLIVPDIDLLYWAYQIRDASLFAREEKIGVQYPTVKFTQNPNQASFEQRFLWTFASNASTLHADGASNRVSDEELRKMLASLNFEAALDRCTEKASIEIQRRYPEDHINWFNAKKLISMIQDVGFDSVYRSGYGQSRCPVMRDLTLFDSRRPEIGLYIEAIR